MIAFIFWFLTILTIYIYAGYPLTIYLLSKAKQQTQIAQDNQAEPPISVIIPAYNESLVIEKKIRNILEIDYPQDKLEIWVMSDGSTDGTDEIVKGFEAQGVRLFRQEPRMGKTAGLGKVVPLCSNKIVIFTDANSMYDKDAIRLLTRHFQNPKVGLVCGELQFLNEKDGTVAGESLYWKYEYFLKRCESRMGELLVVNGSIYAIRKKLFEAMPSFIADDFGTPMIIGSKGYRLLYEPKAKTYEYAAHKLTEEFKTKTRIITRGFFGTKTLWKHIFLKSSLLRRFEFCFHKFLRWQVGLYQILLFILNLLLMNNGIIYPLFFAGQIIFYLTAIIGYYYRKNGHKPPLRIIMLPTYFCEVNAAALVAFGRLIKNKPQATWTSAGTTRR